MTYLKTFLKVFGFVCVVTILITFTAYSMKALIPLSYDLPAPFGFLVYLSPLILSFSIAVSFAIYGANNE